MVRLLLALLLITQLATLGLWTHWLYLYVEPEETEEPEAAELMRVATPPTVSPGVSRAM
jgi:hypothetical protein